MTSWLAEIPQAPVLLGALYGRCGWLEQGLQALPAARYASGGPCCPTYILLQPPPHLSPAMSSLPSPPSTPGPLMPGLLRRAELGLHAAGLVLSGRYLIPLLLQRKKDSENREG